MVSAISQKIRTSSVHWLFRWENSITCYFGLTKPRDISAPKWGFLTRGLDGLVWSSSKERKEIFVCFKIQTYLSVLQNARLFIENIWDNSRLPFAKNPAKGSLNIYLLADPGIWIPLQWSKNGSVKYLPSIVFMRMWLIRIIMIKKIAFYSVKFLIHQSLYSVGQYIGRNNPLVWFQRCCFKICFLECLAVLEIPLIADSIFNSRENWE